MEIRDPIHGSIVISEDEKPILDSLSFQRLRAIKQLGFGEFSFPGGMHNRYVHSVGAFYLASQAFEAIFKNFSWSSNEVKEKFKQVTKLAALLHDIGHGPLSHTTEEVMPCVKDLKLPLCLGNEKRKATHEDYTIKIILDSDLTKTIETHFPSFKPLHIASLIFPHIQNEDGFFIEQGLDFKPLLSQLISSELDCDRMDYLVRDAYYCGTNYGKVEISWLLSNLSFHERNKKLYLCFNQRALYAFEDFLLARHHMYLMVYFHHKSVIYDEMLFRYFSSDECDFHLPSDIDSYLECTDHTLYTHLKKSHNPWAKRIVTNNPYVIVYEEHSDGVLSQDILKLKKDLQKQGITFIHVNSQTQMSKLKKPLKKEGYKKPPIFIKDTFQNKATLLQKASEIFDKYEKKRTLERLYCDYKDRHQVKQLISQLLKEKRQSDTSLPLL